MRSLFRILIILLLATNCTAQCIQVPRFMGPDTTFGTYTVYERSTGVVTTGSPDPCFGPSYYGFWTGAGAPGSYRIVFSKPVYKLNFDCTGLNTGEYFQFTINNVFYPLTPANITYWGECTPGASGTCYLSAGLLYGPSPAGFNGAGVQIEMCNGIDSVEVYCNSAVAGGIFKLCVDTTIMPYCLQAFNNGPVCEGDTLWLWALGDSAGASYHWYGPGAYSSTKKQSYIYPATLASSGTYSVVRTVGSVTDTETTSVIIKPTPKATAGYSNPMCFGVATTLNLYGGPSGGGYVYSWTGPAGFVSGLQNPTRFGFVSADTGFYTISVTLNGCTDTAIAHVIWTPTPAAPVITGKSTYCTGETFVPFTVTGTSILWYSVATGGTGTTTSPTVNTSTAGTTSVWASQTVSGCESPRATFTVTVNPTPSAPVITGTNTYCQYSTYVAPSSSGTSVLWYTTSTGGVGSTTVPVINTAISGTTTIYSTQTVGGCESPRAAFAITVNPKPLPPIVVANPSNYCPGQTFVPFTVVTGVGLTWYNAPTGGTGSTAPPVINTSIPGTYTNWVSQTVSGCESDRASITVTVADSVIANFDYVVKYGCKADTVVFNNTSKQTNTYAWKFGDGFSSILKNPTHVYLIQAIDTVTLYSSIATCKDSITKYIDLVHPLHASFHMDTNLICQGNTITFADSFSVGTTLSYLWEYGDSSLHPPITGTATTHTYPISGVYRPFLVVTDFRNCTDTMYKTLYVDTISPISVAMTDTVLCIGTHLTFTGTYSSVGLTDLVWDLGNTDSIKNINPLVYGYQQPGWYTITARARYRVCPDTFTTRKLAVVAQPEIDLGPDQTICLGSNAITLQDGINAGNPNATWDWSTGDKGPGITVTKPGVYTATVKLDGCKNSSTVTIKNDCYINIPNIFTPNGDGLNDFFYPHQYLSSGLVQYHMQIFNRWGELVFETTSLTGRGWDGKLNDVPQPEGVYIYLIEGTFKDGQKEQHTGNLTLLR